MQAVIAIENPRILNELLSQAVNSTLKLETVLSTIVANAASSPALKLERSMCSMIYNASFICALRTAWIRS
jgi:hypothetical protein